jgi:hypothetical protein
MGSRRRSAGVFTKDKPHITRMAISRTKCFALLASALIGMASAAFAQDSGPLLDLLVKKGIVNDQEAENLRAELARDSSAAVVSTISGGKSTVGLSISGRLQVQYADLGGNIDGASTSLVATDHFFMRRVYLGAKATLGNGWTGNFNYDFAGSTFDQAFIQWRKDDTLAVDVGLRKVPFGLEEWYTSSGSLKAIERSPATRYFVESNNGRRLGAGSYRVGVFVGGKIPSGLFYNVAVTDPERDETFTGVSSSGTNINNNLAYWGNLGFSQKFAETWTYTVSSSAGYLPDQGGPSNTGLGKGDGLTVYNAFFDLTDGTLDVQGEYFGSDNHHGVSATQNSKGNGWSLQSSYLIDKFEPVIRYSIVNSDHRGVALSDGIRSAPSGGTMDKMSELFLGANYYFRGNDVKLQAGYIYGESKDTVTGGAAKATTQGVRSQLQLNF